MSEWEFGDGCGGSGGLGSFKKLLLQKQFLRIQSGMRWLKILECILKKWLPAMIYFLDEKLLEYVFTFKFGAVTQTRNVGFNNNLICVRKVLIKIDGTAFSVSKLAPSVTSSQPRSGSTNGTAPNAIRPFHYLLDAIYGGHKPPVRIWALHLSGKRQKSVVLLATA